MGCLTNFLWAKWVIGLGVDLWESVWTFCEVQRPPNIRDFQVRWYFERTFFYPIMWDTQCHEPTIWGWLESAPFTVNVGRCFLGFSPLLHPFWKWHGYLKWRYISYMYWFEVCTRVRILCIYHVECFVTIQPGSCKITKNHRKSSSNAVLEVERRYNLKASESELFRLLVPGVKSIFDGAGLLVHVLLGNDFWCSGWEGLNTWYHASRHVAGGNGWLVALVFRNREQPNAF